MLLYTRGLSGIGWKPECRGSCARALMSAQHLARQQLQSRRNDAEHMQRKQGVLGKVWWLGGCTVEG